MNPRRCVPLLLLVIVFGSRLFSQEIHESNFVKYTRLQGLSNNYVSGIVQDSSGYIWIATHKGLNRFNGNTFESIYKDDSRSPLPDNLIVSMHRRVGNEIIGASRAGGFAFTPDCIQYKKFIVPSDSTIYFWANHAMDISKDKNGNYLLSTKTGLYVFDSTGAIKKRFDHFVPGDGAEWKCSLAAGSISFTDGTTFQQNELMGSMYDAGTNVIDTFYVHKNKTLRENLVNNTSQPNVSWKGRNGELLIANGLKNSIETLELCSSQTVSSPMPFNIEKEIGENSMFGFLSDTTAALTCRNSGFIFCIVMQVKENSAATVPGISAEIFAPHFLKMLKEDYG